MMIKAIRKGMLLLVKSSWRFARRHPLVVGLMLFIPVLYRHFPSLFAFIVYSSPVIGCTALLLGAILVYGEPAVPEAECKSGDVSVQVKTGESDEPAIRIYEEVSGKDNTILGMASSSRNSDKEVQGEKTPSCQLNAREPEFVEKKVFSIEKQDESLRQITEGLKLEIKKPSENQLESSLGSPWQQVNSHDISSCSSESEQEYSLSPSESMSDIIPIIDELHPLLESDNTQTYRSVDTSDAASRGSSPDHEESDDGSLEGETENQADEEDEEPQEEKDNNDDVMKWTADDQKNLMDLGSSELERNQRLENLIAKRRARKLQRFQTDKNLIDLDNEPLPFMEEISRLNVHVPPISAPRHNPFDPSYDSEKSMDLPPIPGSAPSVLLPRTNPFDVPYNLDRSPGLVAESSRSYGVTASQKDHDTNLKPFFVAEKTSETDFVSFERQSSEKSDSKESSTSDSDSNSSDANVDQELSEKAHEELVEHESELSEEVGSFDLEQELHAADTEEEEAGSSSAISSATNLEAIEESYDGSGSSYGSKAVQKNHESGIRVEPITNPSHTEDDYARSCQPSPCVVEENDDIHVADPVYDSSPSSKAVPSPDEPLLSESKGKEGYNAPSSPERREDLHEAGIENVQESTREKLEVSDEIHPKVDEVSEELKTSSAAELRSSNQHSVVKQSAELDADAELLHKKHPVEESSVEGISPDSIKLQ